MPNIPRRKIYEKMLEYEDSMIELQVIFLNDENFHKGKENIIPILEKLKKSYLEIKVLFVLFLENMKFENEEEFENKLKELFGKSNEVDQMLFENENLKDDFKNSVKEINEVFSKQPKIETLEELKTVFDKFDSFNHLIPNILALRRDKMK